VSAVLPLVEELVPAPDLLETCARFQDLPFLTLLDSAADPEHLGRHSFLTAAPPTAVRSKGLLTQQLVDGQWIRVAADPLAFCGEEVCRIETAGLLRRVRALESASEPEVILNGRRVLCLASNNYLGLAAHPEVVDAAADAARRYGAGSGSARLVTGGLPVSGCATPPDLLPENCSTWNES